MANHDQDLNKRGLFGPEQVNNVKGTPVTMNASGRDEVSCEPHVQ